jgi:hypothetical protein
VAWQAIANEHTKLLKKLGDMVLGSLFASYCTHRAFITFTAVILKGEKKAQTEDKPLDASLKESIIIQASDPSPEEGFSHFQLASFAPRHPRSAGDTVAVRAHLLLVVVPAPGRLE